jgi:hypothetical protein
MLGEILQSESTIEEEGKIEGWEGQCCNRITRTQENPLLWKSDKGDSSHLSRHPLHNQVLEEIPNHLKSSRLGTKK